MVAEAIGGAMVAAAGVLAYAVRGPSSQLLAPSVCRGPRDRRSIALSFDDGPSESTPAILDVLSAHHAPATFFQCGANVRRLAGIARAVAERGHEIGNHSDTHARFYFRTAKFIYHEISRAQDTIRETTGSVPRYLRVPYGARWFSLRRAQRELDLRGVMWTVTGLDWKIRADAIVKRIVRRTANGAIICLHDGRKLAPEPDVRETVKALERLLPILLEKGFRFVTISNLLCQTT